ncbi:MAG: hypothetical protein JWM74_4591, partial [Myxococcaceae bacterium]|nr:hypothetical protein [Myxococcaceae bacterium]
MTEQNAAIEDRLTPVHLHAAHDKLRERDQILRAIFEGSLDGMLLADDESRYVEVNPAACAIFGLPKSELLGRTIAELTAPDNMGAAAGPALVDQDNVRGELSILRPDGTRCVLDVSAVANILPGFHLSVLRDITARKQ